MTKVLVTGGAGFIGANLCKKLLEKNYKVIAVDNLITSSEKNIKEFTKNPNFTFVKHDITKPFPKSLKYKLSSLNSIYHLACPTGVPNIQVFGKEMLLTSSLGTLNIVELALKHKAKIVFTSSSEIYGDPKEFPQTEQYSGNVDPIGLRSPYEEGKRFSESLIIYHVRKHDLSATIARLFNTYGPKMSRDDTRVIPKFINLSQKNKPLPVEGNGLQTRTFCYVDDLVNGLMLLMKKGKNGEAYNIGGGKEVKIKELAKMIIKITGSKSKIVFVKRPSHDHKRRLPNLSKIHSLGWKSTISLEKGLVETIKTINKINF